MVAKLAQIEKSINATQEMVLRNVLIQVEGIKLLRFTTRLLSHHGHTPVQAVGAF